MSVDTINGSFELFGGLLQIFNIRRLIKDKQVKGISWPVVGFFTTWGFWNLFYYPNLHQYLSFSGGVLIVITNLAWLLLLLRYR